jgi:hypothetical protein
MGKATVSGASSNRSSSSLTGTKKFSPASSWIAGLFTKPSASMKSTRASPRT